MCIPRSEVEAMQMLRTQATTGVGIKGCGAMGAYHMPRLTAPVGVGLVESSWNPAKDAEEFEKTRANSQNGGVIDASGLDSIFQIWGVAMLAASLTFVAWRGAMGYVVGKRMGQPAMGAIANIVGGLTGMTALAAFVDDAQPNGKRRGRRSRRRNWSRK